MKTLADVLKNYANHPDFLGIELVDVNQCGAVDDAPLHIASRAGNEEDVLALIGHGAEVNLKGDLGNTALHFAAMSGKLRVVAILLEKGADPFVSNEFGETPMKVAQLGGYSKVEDVLREHSSRSLRGRGKRGN